MKSFVAILVLAGLVALASAAVVPEYIEESLQLGEQAESDADGGKLLDPIIEAGEVNGGESASHTRQRRFTCDVFSFSSAWATPNHSACALKCVGMGRKGGHCENNNCICRDDRYIG